MHASSSPVYAAILGNQPGISLAELAATIPGFTLVRSIGVTAVLFSCSGTIDQSTLDTWGGVFLVAKELRSAASLQDIPRLMREQTAEVHGKVTFSLRALGVDREAIRKLYRTCKKHLADDGIPARYIGNERKPPVSGQLHDEGVVDGKNGCELLLIGHPDERTYWVGRTIAVQDPRSYTTRDMQKPVRDTRAGLLPPKLAQVMLNLGLWAHAQAQQPAESLVVYDPFCGTGVIPMEALLRGMAVLGSDISQKAVTGCTTNMEWIRKQNDIKKRETPSSLWKQDATKPFAFDKATPATKMRPTLIVTETMLGPPLSDRPTAKQAQSYRSECDALEIDFLKNCAAQLPGVPIVATFPLWYVRSGPVYLERVWKEMERIGYHAVLPEGIPSEHPNHASLLYRRPDQIVGREIVVLIPTPATS